jgi:hypothetical protein
METRSPKAFATARAASRLSAEYVLRSLVLLGNLTDGDLLTGLISAAIVQGNVAHLESGPQAAYASVADIPPDTERRPVSAMAVSASLRLPYETVRRHIARMVREGLCERRPGGVVVPTAVLSSPLHESMLLANLSNLRRLVRGLAALGI